MNFEKIYKILIQLVAEQNEVIVETTIRER